MDCSPPGSSVHGILQARILEWIAISFSRGSSWPKNLIWVSCISGRLFTIWATREAKFKITYFKTLTTLIPSPKFSSVQSLSRVQLFATLWTAARQVSLSITNSWSLLKFMSIESVMPSNHLILCHPFLLPPSIFPSIKVFSNESVLRIKWPKYWSFSYNISPSNEHQGLISFRMD